MKAEDYKITISWNVEDVLSLDDSLTTDQCIEVLDLARDNHDANYGISWDTLSSYIDEVKPEIIIQHLVDAKLITSKEDGAFILCKNLDNLAFDDFRTLIPWRLPKIMQNQSTISDNEQYIKLLQKYQTALAATLHVPVSSLFDSNCQ